MSGHKRFTVATNVQVYFCDPRSPWPRGSNENTNGLLRQYFPRGTDLSRFSQAYLNGIALRLNQRPRKPWPSKPLPIDCNWCCTDRLNSPPESRHCPRVAKLPDQAGIGIGPDPTIYPTLGGGATLHSCCGSGADRAGHVITARCTQPS